LFIKEKTAAYPDHLSQTSHDTPGKLVAKATSAEGEVLDKCL
jgi:hypothetical protein